MYSAALSIAIATISSFVGGALQQNHNFTEHAQEVTAYIPCNGISPPPKRQFFFVPEIILWRLAPMLYTFMHLLDLPL